jgi:hypothetical protein
MIIRPGEYLSGPTLAALLQAMQSVVRIRFPDNRPGVTNFGTGFLLTPRLVITAGHGYRETHPHTVVDLFSPTSPQPEPRSYSARFESFVRSPSAHVRLQELAGLAGGMASDREAVIFRLTEDAKVTSILRLRTADVARSSLSEWIFLLSYPWGRPEVVLSLGELRKIDEASLSYDANTEWGAGGAPILNTRAEVIGLHSAADPRSNTNLGISIDSLLADLASRRPDLWEEVRAHHGLQTSRELRAQAKSIQATEHTTETARRAYLRSAAVLWSFDPGSIEPYPELKHERTARSLLLDDVDSVRLGDGTTRWALKPSVRAEILRELGTAEQFREVRQSNPSVASDGAQALLDRVLSEPLAIDVAHLSTKELEWFRPLIEWFGPYVWGLPSAEEVERRLAARRLFEPFENLGGRHFRGRRDELAQLHEHLFGPTGKPAVLVIHGPGGSGKSSLLARFILDESGPETPRRVPFAYLDFDRATLESRKPASLYTELLRQLALQGTDEVHAAVKSPTFGALTSQEALEEAARLVARAIDAVCKHSGDTPFLLALDSFEEVQFHTGQPHGTASAWLDALVRASPRVRVFVLGRAPVEGLTVADQPPVSHHLGPLDEESARAMLEQLGVTDADCVAQLIQAARGNPLTLRVGATFLARYSKEELKEALERLPSRLVQAVLYDRVLERIHDEQVRKLARPGLVLRRVTPSLLREVIAPGAGIEVTTEQQPQDLFEALRRETFLTYEERADILVHRPELRVITLDLLAHSDPALVRGVDTKAAEYYQRQPGPAARAEELYHRLRLDAPTAVLDALWVPGVAEALRLDPEEKLPERARRWLDAKGGQGIGTSRASPPLTSDTLVFQMRRRIWLDGEYEPDFEALALATDEMKVLSTLRSRQRAADAFAERAAGRAITLGEAGELLRVRLIQTALAKKPRMQSARLKQALDIQLPLGEPFQSALLARHLELRLNSGDLRSDSKELMTAVATFSQLGEPSLRRDPTLGRYILAVISSMQPAALSRGLQLLGLGSRDAREIEMDAAVLASAVQLPQSLELASRFLGIELKGSPRKAWKAVLEAVHHREDANQVLALIFRSSDSFSHSIASLWKVRGEAVFHSHLFEAVYRWQLNTLPRVAFVFDEHQLEELGDALAVLARVPHTLERLSYYMPRSLRENLPVLPGDGPQLRSDLRVLAAREPGMLVPWLSAVLSTARASAPSTVPTFERALRTLGLTP